MELFHKKNVQGRAGDSRGKERGFDQSLPRKCRGNTGVRFIGKKGHEMTR